MLRSVARKVLSAIDGWYYRRHRLQTLGPVLYLGRSLYHGPEIHFEDGTSLRDNEPIGRLHFNNASIAALGEGSLHRTGLRFAKLMRLSLYRLAQCAQSNPDFRDVSVFEGVTWIPEHGKVVGFVSEPVPRSVRRFWLSAHFRILLWAFAPAAQTRAKGGAEPRVYRMTRAALTRNRDKLADSG
ncbi:MAG TPA: hypothetical protein VGN07_20030 [Steroidobacteraceae bacterium]|jgi:hypothetical protein